MMYLQMFTAIGFQLKTYFWSFGSFDIDVTQNVCVSACVYEVGSIDNSHIYPLALFMIDNCKLFNRIT